MTTDAPRTKIQREPRRHLNKHLAWISLDEEVTRIDCLVLDVAPGGARIVTDATIDVRDRFTLALVPKHPTRQACEVVWRNGKTFGIKFLPGERPAQTGPEN